MTPGIFPWRASSLKVILDRPNFRITARGRPVAEQRLSMRTREEFLGSFANLA